MHLQTLIDGGAYGSYGVASTFYTGALQTTTYMSRYRFKAAARSRISLRAGPSAGTAPCSRASGRKVDR